MNHKKQLIWLLLILLIFSALSACDRLPGVPVPNTGQETALLPSGTPSTTATPRPTITATPTTTLTPTPTLDPRGPCPTGGEYLYFYDDKGKTVQKFDLQGSLVCEWPVGEDLLGTLAVAPQNETVYLLDSPQRIRRYNLSGVELPPILSPPCLQPAAAGQNMTPIKAITLSDGSLVLLVMATYEELQIVRCGPGGEDLTRSELDTGLLDIALAPEGSLWAISVLANDPAYSQLMQRNSQTLALHSAREVAYLRGLVAHPSGSLYAARWRTNFTGKHLVAQLDQTGKVLKEYGDVIGHPFAQPEHLVVDSQGSIYVDNSDWRLVKLDPTGKVIADWNMQQWSHRSMVLVNEAIR